MTPDAPPLPTTIPNQPHNPDDRRTPRMGAKLRSRLPKGSGLTAELADELADNPGQVVVIAMLDVDQVVSHIHKDGSRTTVLELIAVEAFDGQPADTLRGMLTTRHETRTGESALFDADDIAGSSTGDSAEEARQLDLARREWAAKLREQAEVADDKETANQLEADADAYEAGNRDGELREQLTPEFQSADEPAPVG